MSGEASGFTAAYQNAAKEGTAHVQGGASGVNVDHSKGMESWQDPTLPFRERIAARVARSAAAVKGARCLDVGCAIGQDLGRLKAALEAHEGSSAQLVGVDLLEAQLVKAREALPGCEFKQGDVGATLPFADKEFDTLQASRLLIHSPDLGKAVDEMIRVMKPGALGVFAEGDMDSSTMMTSDDRLRAVYQKKCDHVMKMCANPRAASTTYRYLLAHPEAENVSMDGWQFVNLAPGEVELNMEIQMLQKLVETGSVTQEDLDYYQEQAAGRAAAEGNFVVTSPIFEVSFTKKDWDLELS